MKSPLEFIAKLDTVERPDGRKTESDHTPLPDSTELPAGHRPGHAHRMGDALPPEQ